MNWSILGSSTIFLSLIVPQNDNDLLKLGGNRNMSYIYVMLPVSLG